MKHLTTAAIGTSLVPAPLLAQDGGGLFAVDPGLSVWTIAVFLLVLWVLWKFAWGPMMGALDAREGGIRESIEEARAMRAEGKELLEEHRRQLADARRQAQELLTEGREAGERLRSEIEGKAREEADRMLGRARKEIERERDRALDTVRREAVDLALAAASRLLAERLDGERDRELIEAYLSRMEESGAAESASSPAVEA